MKLPSFNELSSEQNKLYWIPLDRNMLVTGPPGTGKTVMALYRGQMVINHPELKQLRIIMFNTVLKQYTSEGLGDGAFERGSALSKRIKTMHSCIASWWRKKFRKFPPHYGGNIYNYDWKKMRERLLQAANDKEQAAPDWDHLIIDEGQDFKPGLYLLLRDAGDLKRETTNSRLGLTVLADENQIITEDNSKIDQIRDALSKLPDYEEQSLNKNYRNSVQIAKLAASFYCGLQTGIPDPPKRTGKHNPELSSFRSLSDEVQVIANFASVNANLAIGVIVDSNSTRKAIVDLLRDELGETQPGNTLSLGLGNRAGHTSAGGSGLADQILGVLANGSAMKAKQIASKLRVERSKVNGLLYGGLNYKIEKDDSNKWKLKDGVQAAGTPQARRTPPPVKYGRVQTYYHKDKDCNDAEDLSLDKPGFITVICRASCKGLEFDAVFLPQLQTISYDPGKRDKFKMGMYVMISRAREYLFLSYTSSDGAVPEIIKTIDID